MTRRGTAGNTDGEMDERGRVSGAGSGVGGGQTMCGQEGCFDFHCK